MTYYNIFCIVQIAIFFFCSLSLIMSFFCIEPFYKWFRSTNTLASAARTILFQFYFCISILTVLVEFIFGNGEIDMDFIIFLTFMSSIPIILSLLGLALYLLYKGCSWLDDIHVNIRNKRLGK